MNFNKLQFIAVLVCVIGAFCQDWRPEIVVSPQNATVKEGDDVTLQCQFSRIINTCLWYRGLDKMDINDSYQYFDTNTNGKNTSNCALVITNFKEIDATYWRCYHSELKNQFWGYSTISIKAYLTMALTTIVQPKNVTDVEGGNILLDCVCNKPNASCVWYRKGSIITINDRFRHIHSSNNSTKTTDCSILIRQFSRIDATYWICECVLKSTNLKETCTSNPSYLSLKTSAIRSDIPFTTMDSLHSLRHSLPLTTSNNTVETTLIPKCNTTYNGKVEESSSDLNSSVIINAILSSMLVIIGIIGVIIFWLRGRNEAKKKADSQLKLTKNDASEDSSRQEQHQEHIKSTSHQGRSEVNTVIYLTPKDAYIDMNNPRIKSQHFYEAVPQ